MNLIIRFILVFLCLSFVGCKAELIETKIKTTALKKAMSEGVADVPFKTKITIMGDEKDTRQQIEAFQQIIENYLDIEDIEISKSMMGMDLIIEGSIPLVAGNKLPEKRQDPWGLFIRKNQRKVLANTYPFELALRPTQHFGGFKNQFSEVNILLAPDPYQPILFKFRNNDGSKFRIFSGGVEVAGRHFAIFEGSAKKRLSLKMEGGVYDHTNPVIFFNLQ
ncbi:MAG: hypothetical protein CMM58_05265 [Rhodospirillaceae bacterium]|nr:hypothetical protein [Rhodospirillaceae bacterium]|tara:strand:+ start:2212 stop:2874 length:663 start_codon:yes stop_codon:yes gene_type:complete